MRRLLRLFSFKAAVCFVLLSLPFSVFAASAHNIDTITQVLTNLRSLVNPIANLISIVTGVAGTFFVYRALSMFKVFGMPVSQMSRPGEFGGPIVNLIVGVFMIYIATTSSVLTNSFFGSGGKFFLSGNGLEGNYMETRADLAVSPSDETLASMLQYDRTSAIPWSEIVATLISYVQLIGYVAFVRGWFIMAHVADQNAQHGQLSKGLVHLIGGVLAINFLPMFKIVSNTLFANT